MNYNTGIVDPELMAVTNGMIGLPDACDGEERAAAQVVARMMVNKSLYYGLMTYLEEKADQFSRVEKMTYRAKLRAIDERLCQQALEWLREHGSRQDRPF